MLPRTIFATAIMLLMAGAASAQVQPSLHLKDDKPSRTKAQKEYDKALDRAYQSAIKKIPEPEKKSADPWGDIRPSSAAAGKNKQ
jgi:hypothetical protein